MIVQTRKCGIRRSANRGSILPNIEFIIENTVSSLKRKRLTAFGASGPLIIVKETSCLVIGSY